jgi:receptor protein-tyrosine kinase
MQLGLLSQSDIDLALSDQFDFPYLQAGHSNVSEEVVAAYKPFDRQIENLRSLRSQLMLRWFEDKQNQPTLCIAGTQRGEGRSVLAANLAVIFSQLGEKTLLIDADMRNPRQHALFGISNSHGLAAALTGRANEPCMLLKACRDCISCLLVAPLMPRNYLADPLLPSCWRSFPLYLT